MRETAMFASFRRYSDLILVVLALCAGAWLLAGCAEPPDLANARAILFEARKARAEQCGADKFREAEAAINRAETSVDPTDAYVARRAAEAALAAAQAGCIEGNVTALASRRDRLSMLKGKIDEGSSTRELEKVRGELEAT
jgi:hypothetical protein